MEKAFHEVVGKEIEGRMIREKRGREQDDERAISKREIKEADKRMRDGKAAETRYRARHGSMEKTSWRNGYGGSATGFGGIKDGQKMKEAGKCADY